MTKPEFDSPLDDALDDFRLSWNAASDHKMFRSHLTTGLEKLVEYTRELEERVKILEGK